jgi:hypothetical protein
MNADIEKLRELIAKATPGPWQAMNAYQWDSIIGDIDGPDDGEMHYESVTDITSHHDRSRANAALIAAAISALPALLAEVERLRRVEARWAFYVHAMTAESGLARDAIQRQAFPAHTKEAWDACIDKAMSEVVLPKPANGAALPTSGANDKE